MAEGILSMLLLCQQTLQQVYKVNNQVHFNIRLPLCSPSDAIHTLSLPTITVAMAAIAIATDTLWVGLCSLYALPPSLSLQCDQCDPALDHCWSLPNLPHSGQGVQNSHLLLGQCEHFGSQNKCAFHLPRQAEHMANKAGTLHWPSTQPQQYHN